MVGMAPVTKADPWKQFEGEVIDGKLVLGEYLGGDDRQGVFLSKLDAAGTRKVAVKLLRDDPHVSKRRLQQWKFAEKLSHPHLIRIFSSGWTELRDQNMLYAVMEFADENLSQVIPHRALSADEAHELLQPAIKALAYLHREGFVHGHLKPSNFLAVDGTLRLSSDHLGRTGDQDPGKPDAYAPPEIDLEGFSPPGDAWSLGMTLAEAMTQRRPVWEGTAPEEPTLPDTIPQPLLDIARNCLRRNPRSRWKMADIEKYVRQASPETKIEKHDAPPGAPKRLIFVLSAILTVILAVVLFGPRIFNRAESAAVNIPPAEPTPTASTPGTPKQQPPPPQQKADPPPAQTVLVETKAAPPQPAPVIPAADKSGTPLAKAAAPVTPPPQPVTPPAVAENKPKPPEPAATTPAASDGSIQKVMPEVNAKARGSIHGRVRVTIRVRVDATGTVLSAEVQSEGPSKYFADAALQASRRWKFPSGDGTRVFDLQYIFQPHETSATPVKVGG